MKPGDAGVTRPEDASTPLGDAGLGQRPDSGAERGDAGATGSLGCKTADLSAAEQQLIDLPADTWFEAPGTPFGSVCNKPEYQYLRGVEGCSAVINDWCGGVYDSVRNKMLLWGGGHDGYWGNEVWAFDVKTMRWAVDIAPSPGITPDNQKDPLDDGLPVSRHTYDQLAFISKGDRLWGFGGATARGGGGSYLTWAADLVAQKWTNLNPTTPPGYEPIGTYEGSAAYDAATERIMLKTIGYLYAYDIATNTYTRLADLGYAPLWPRYATGGGRGVIDSKRKQFWVVGGSGYLVYDLASSKFITNDWVTTGGGDYDSADRLGGYPEQQLKTGGGDLITAHAPGLDYDLAADALVGWKGGAPYALDLAAKKWSVKSAVGAPQVPVSNGTYGRWRYLPRYNVFILVNAADQNVFFYKHTAGCGP